MITLGESRTRDVKKVLVGNFYTTRYDGFHCNGIFYLIKRIVIYTAAFAWRTRAAISFRIGTLTYTDGACVYVIGKDTNVS